MIRPLCDEVLLFSNTPFQDPIVGHHIFLPKTALVSPRELSFSSLFGGKLPHGDRI